MIMHLYYPRGHGSSVHPRTDCSSGKEPFTPTENEDTPGLRGGPGSLRRNTTSSRSNGRSLTNRLVEIGSVCLLLGSCALVQSRAEERLFPADAGLINVKSPPYNAKGDGETDDTAAIQAAIRFMIDRTVFTSMKPFLFFPTGTYVVSKTLESRLANTNGYAFGWRHGMSLIGQNETNTVIRLIDGAPGFDDRLRPSPLIRTASEEDPPGTRHADGSGATAFRHAIVNLTIDTGSGNPGAVGVDFLANNWGGIEDVTIRSGDGDGVCGVLMTRYAPGPAMLKRVRIFGFDTGLVLTQTEPSMTLEHITLAGQKRFGIDVAQNVLNIRGLTSSNAVPVIRCRDLGLVTLLDGTFTGGAPSVPAITNSAKLYLRNITSSGYGEIVANARECGKLTGGPDVPGATGMTNLAEYITQPAVTLFPSPLRGLHLPVEETPEFHTNDFSQWANVRSFGATPDANSNDDAPAIQAAIDSGKPIVYFPRGHYAVRSPIILRGSVRKLAGIQSSLGTNTSFRGGALIRFEGTNSDPCILEHLRICGWVEHTSTNTLVLRHLELENGGYRNTNNGTGKVFLEDIIAQPIRVNVPQQLWARQLDVEEGPGILIENHGGVMWIFGLKNEVGAQNNPWTVLKAVGGYTEVLGAMTRPIKAVPANAPLYINEGGSLSFTHLLSQFDFPLWVRETRNGVTRLLRHSTPLFRGVPLYAGYLDEVQLGPPKKTLDGRCNLEVNAPPGRACAIESSEDISNWQVLATNTATGLPWRFTDSAATNCIIRFYRARGHRQ